MKQFFREDPIRSFLLLSLIAHACFLVSWPRPKTGRYQDMNRIAVLLVPQATRRSTRHQAPAKKRIIAKKKSVVSKKKRIMVAKKPGLKKSSIKKTRRIVKNKKPDLSKIRQKLAREEQEKTVSKIKERLAKNKTVPPAASSAVGNYQLRLYAEQLKSWITDHWQLPELLLKEKLTATVSLTIDKTGNLVSQEPEKMSGNQLFDDSILKAITRSAPFPPFPPSMDKTREEFVITFDPNDIQ